MRNLLTRLARPGKNLALGTLLAGTATLAAAAQTIYGLQTYPLSLVTFQASAPGTLTATVAITGLASGQSLVGLDTRPATGELFALGYNYAAASGMANAQVYKLAASGVLTAVGSPIALALGTSPRIGFDFNPTVDGIRVTATNGANYRLSPVTGGIAATDGLLAYASTDPNAGYTPSVGSSAYTNSYVGSTTTTLYGIDETASRLVIQNPPNDGTLNTVGPLGVSVSVGNLNQSADLDIAYIGGQNVAYMSAVRANFLTATATTTLYTVSLTTGTATAVGTLGTANALTRITDIAVATSTVATATRPAELATDFTLSPNPLAGGEASLSFGLPRAATVQLLVTDALGRTVDALEAGPLPAGPHTLRWSRPGRQAAGLYFFRLRFDGQPAGTRAAAVSE